MGGGHPYECLRLERSGSKHHACGNANEEHDQQSASSLSLSSHTQPPPQTIALFTELGFRPRASHGNAAKV
jgi:hypothetical protein